MKAALVVIDAVIATKPVRWLLLALVTLMLVVSVISLVRQKAIALQLAAIKGEKAEYAAYLLIQNEAVVKAAQAYQKQQKKVLASTQQAARLADQLKQRRVEIREVVLRGDCPAMVQQILDEVRK